MASFRISPMVALLLTLSLSFTLLPIVHTKTINLTIYEFEDRTPPDNTVIVSATPSGNLSTSEFGTLRVVTNVLRATNATNSTVLGSLVGLANTLRDGGVYATFNFVYETQEYNGTIGVQGRLDAAENGELVVTGGSGSFRLAQGWVWLTLVTNSDPNNVIYKHEVHLEID